MNNKSNGLRPALIIVAMIIALLFGTVGSAVVGGLPGYIVASYRVPAVSAAPDVGVAPALAYLTLTE